MKLFPPNGWRFAHCSCRCPRVDNNHEIYQTVIGVEPGARTNDHFGFSPSMELCAHRSMSSVICYKGLDLMNLKLQLFALVLYLGFILCGFVLIPKEPPLFGMGMIPGTMALFSRFGLPLILSFGISVAVYQRSRAHNGINVAFFFVCSILVWMLTFVLFH